MSRLYYLWASLAFVLSMYLIVKGHRISGRPGLIMMLAGLASLILDLYFYNRRHS